MIEHTAGNTLSLRPFIQSPPSGILPLKVSLVMISR
jgi:hypothetical protein